MSAPATPARRRGLPAPAAAYAAYLLLAFLATWPLLRRARDHVFGLATPELNIWAMGFVLHQLPREPLHLFDGNAFYPYPRSLAFSEHLFVPSLLGAPIALLSGNLVLAHNLVALVTLSLAGLGMFLLARELTGDAPAAFAAGVVYAFHTWNINELIRLQILSNQYFPFLLLALARFFSRPSRGSALLAGAAYALQSLSCMYWALYAPLLTLSFVAFLQVRHRRSWRELRPLAIALGAALLLAVLFGLTYVRAGQELGLARTLPDPVGMNRYFDVLPGNRLYAGLLGTAHSNQDAAHFLGFSAIALGMLGAAAGRLQLTGRAPFVGLTAAGFLLSLGPQLRWNEHVLAPGPYMLLWRLVPGFQNVRYPERFCVFLLLGLCPLLAAGLARLRPRIGTTGALALAGVLFVEHLSSPLPLAPLPTGPAIPEVYHRLAGMADVKVVADVPGARHRMERLDALPMYLSTVHWKRTAQGFTGYFPPAYNFVRWRLFHFPEAASVRFLQRFGVDTVVVSPEEGDPPSWVWNDPRWRVDGPFAGGHVVLHLIDANEQTYGLRADRAHLDLLDRGEWDVQASYPGARLAIDGEVSTAWTTGEERQGRGDFYRIRFPRRERIARVSLQVASPYEFPTSLKLLGETDSGWEEIPIDTPTAYDGLFADLLHRPRDAWLTLEFEPRDVNGVRLRIAETDPFWMPWSLAEIQVERAQSPAAADQAAAISTTGATP
jgi:hypothetical protein